MPDRSPDLQCAGETLATTGDPQVVPDGAGGAGIGCQFTVSGDCIEGFVR
jgi:hypothetical protein